MSLGNLSVKITADIGQYQTNLNLVSKTAQEQMGVAGSAVTEFEAAINRAGTSTAVASQQIEQSMKAANDAIVEGSAKAAESIEQVSTVADNVDMRPLGERIAQAIGTGIGVGIVAAEKGWDAFVAYTKTKAMIIGIAISAAFAVAGLSAIYTGYKVLSHSLGFIQGLLTGDSYKSENIDALIEANNQVKEIKKSLSMTAQQAAETNEALKALGIDKSAYVGVFKSAQEAIAGNTEVLDALGVKYGSVNELIASSAEKLNEYKEGWDRAQIAQLIGIGGAEQVAEAAKVTAAALSEARARLSDYHLGMSTEGQAAIDAYKNTVREFQNNLDLMRQGFKTAIADNTMPILTELADFFKDGFPSAVGAFRVSIATVTSLVYGLKTSAYIVSEAVLGLLSSLGSMIVGVAVSAAAVVRGDFTSAKDELVRGWENAKDRLNGIGLNISEQAKNNAAAMRLAWALDDRAGGAAAGGKSAAGTVDAINLAKQQAKAYQELMATVGLRIDQQSAELASGERLGEMQRKLIEVNRGLESGTIKLNDAQRKEVIDALTQAVEQEKRIKAAEDARRKAGASTSSAYDGIAKNLSERIALLQTESVQTEAVSEAQKTALRILADMRDGTVSLTQAQAVKVGLMLEELLAADQAATARKEQLKNAEAMAKADDQALVALQSQIDQERARASEIGKTREEIELLAFARMRDAAAADDQAAAAIRLAVASGAAGEYADAYTQHANQLERAAEAKRELASIRLDASGAEALLAEANAAKQAGEELGRMLDPARGRDFGLAIKGGVSEAVSAIVKLDAAFRQYSTNQEMLSKQIALAQKEANGDPVKLAKRMDDINKKNTENQLANYGAIAGAAKGFFNEQSRGYKALQAAEQVFQAMQLAMTLSTTAAKLISIESITAATVGGEVKKTAAIETGLGIQLAADRVKGVSAGNVAIATQAAGDPYTAWARMAAMAAAMAALGFATGAFGGDGGADSHLAADRQKMQGAGTVFGDAMAKSESILKSIDLMQKNSDQMLPLNQQMLSSLRSIQSNIGGLINLVVRTNGLTSGSNFGIAEGTISSGNVIGNALSKLPVIGGLLGGLANLWGKTTQTITDSGIQFGGFLRDLQNGIGYLQYANVSTTESSWFGLKKDTTNSVVTQGLSAELTQQFALIFSSLEKSLKVAAKGLGSDADAVSKVLGSLKIDTTTVSLKGLSGQALQDAINSVISKAMDQMSAAAFPGLDAFRQVGEGYTQTVMRIASGVEVANAALEKLGISAINYGQIINKQGDIGGEIVRQSIIAREGLSGVGKIIESMSGSAQDLAAAYKELQDIRKQMAGVGLNGADLGNSLINGAGSTKDLSSALSTYQDKYFSDAEKAAAATQSVAAEFAKLGVQMPHSKEDFKKLIQQTGTSTDAAAKLTGQLLVLSGAFSDMVDAVDKAQAAQKQAVQDSFDTYASLAANMKKYRESLILSSSSVMTPMEKYQAAKSAYQQTLALAKSGDKDAQGRIQQAANDFLEASKVINASGDAYKDDFNEVLKSSEQMQAWAQQQADLAQASLDAINAGVIATGKVEQAVRELGRDREVWTRDPVKPRDPAATAQVDFSQYGRASDVALVEEIKRLNEQVAELRKDANANANDQIAATYDATARNAQTVADATKSAQLDAQWSQTNQGVLRK